MARISTQTVYVELDGDYGTVEGVELTCDRCGHSEESFGIGEPSLMRCALLLRENCPQGEKNFYVIEQ